MRRQRRGSVIRITAALGAVAMTGACAHNDVLVFGTSTTIGLNVETVSAGGAPSIVLGFEREEAVWMPLVLNGRGSRLDLCVEAKDDCTQNEIPISEAMYRSVIITGEGDDQIEQRDTYSVFASLGAKFNGRASTNNGAEAGGGLAQFFATGNAAVNISANEALVTALKVSSEGSANAQAAAVQAASSDGAAGFDALVGALTPEQRSAAVTSGRAAALVSTARVNRIVVCAQDPQTGIWRWLDIARTLTVSPTLRPSDKARLESITTEAALRAELRTEPEWQVEAERAAKALNYC